jgi:hypothetical protein
MRPVVSSRWDHRSYRGETTGRIAVRPQVVSRWDHRSCRGSPMVHETSCRTVRDLLSFHVQWWTYSMGPLVAPGLWCCCAVIHVFVLRTPVLVHHETGGRVAFGDGHILRPQWSYLRQWWWSSVRLCSHPGQRYSCAVRPGGRAEAFFRVFACALVIIS